VDHGRLILPSIVGRLPGELVPGELLDLCEKGGASPETRRQLGEVRPFVAPPQHPPFDGAKTGWWR